MAKSLDPDQARHFVGPDVFEKYQQRALGDKELLFYRLKDASLVCTSTSCCCAIKSYGGAFLV